MSLIEATPDLLARWPIPPVAQATDKDARGRVLVIGGGAEVAGAVLLTGVAALRTGAGKLQIGAPRSLVAALAIATPEARVLPLAETPAQELAAEAGEELAGKVGRADAVVVGPGMLDADAAGALVTRLVAAEGPPMVVDAAAMPSLAQSPAVARAKAGRLVLTPHAGEMAGLMGCARDEIEADPLAAARRLAATTHAVVAIKGAVTFIVSPDGQAWRHDGGSPGLATSGSGDVLAGVIAGFIARGAPPAQAAVWGVCVHGLCGRRLAERIAPVGFLARELLDEIAPVVADLEAAVANDRFGARNMPRKV